MSRQLLCAAIALSLAGCASIRADDARATERLLIAAGFQMNAADTPEKLAHLQATPCGAAEHVRRGEGGGGRLV